MKIVKEIHLELLLALFTIFQIHLDIQNAY